MGETRQEARQGMRQGTVLCPADNGAAAKETAGAKVKSGAGALPEAGTLPASRAAAVAGSATSAKSSARSRARAAARKFLDEEKEYQMGDIAAEQPNRLTAGLSDTFATNTKDGVRMLLAVDKEAAAILKKSLLSREYKEFAAAVTDTFKKGGRVILSGCGSSGRLCMRLEASWRKALKDMSAVNPGRETLLNDLADKVITLMTGGDYAVIRAVESFEDYASLSRAQMEELCPDENDLVIGVTATAETTSIIGSAMAAAQKGAKVYMLVCTPPESVSNKMKRAEELYSHPNVSSFYIPIKGMALTGSTRMQSSTVEQAAAVCALQEAMAALLEEEGISISKLTPEQFADTFSDLVRSLAQKDSVENMARYLEYETGIYSREGLVTYFSDDYILDILTDTTERSPTFMIPPFLPEAAGEKQNQSSGSQSWAFVKNPLLYTPDAWNDCFMRAPRCIRWTRDEYIKFGLEQEIANRMMPITADALMKFKIGQEPSPHRSANANSTAV